LQPAPEKATIMRTATRSVNFFIVARSSFDFARAAAHAVILDDGGMPCFAGGL
jgi:hypothetical protein